MRPPLAHRVDAGLRPDPARVIARLFLPGEEPFRGESHVMSLLKRAMSLPEEDLEGEVASILARFGDRHPALPDVLLSHAERVGLAAEASRARALLVGAVFTAEFALEGAALCNPSAVAHPDQSGMAAGQLRAAVSLRAIGEGHLSSLAFAEAVIGPGPSWAFEPRVGPPVVGSASPAAWHREHLRHVLADERAPERIVADVVDRLPERFRVADLEEVLAATSRQLMGRDGGSGTADRLRALVASAYQVRFPAPAALSQRVLMPASPEERSGIEDARFVLVRDPGGTALEYRATYTAFDGQDICPRLIVSPDLATFRVYRLAGAGIRNKGMALFPRTIGGRHHALLRSDGESTWLASSADGLHWGDPRVLVRPGRAWELATVGNCGSPIETPQGWLVLTHGVGPMRTYSIGAMLLDLDDPSVVLGRLDRPLLAPAEGHVDGYVPHVVYSCGGLVHDGRLWMPYGANDCRVEVAWAELDEVLAAMVPVPSGAGTALS